MNMGQNIVAIILALCIAFLYGGMIIEAIITPDCDPSDEITVIAIKEMTLAIIGGLIGFMGYRLGQQSNGVRGETNAKNPEQKTKE